MDTDEDGVRVVEDAMPKMIINLATNHFFAYLSRAEWFSSTHFRVIVSDDPEWPRLKYVIEYTSEPIPLAYRQVMTITPPSWEEWERVTFSDDLDFEEDDC